MPLQLAEVQTKAEMAEIVSVEWEAFSKPLNSFWDIQKGPSIEECTERQWAWHEAEPGSHWLKVVDRELGQVVGGAEWIIHKTDPFLKPPMPMTAFWWPEGELKLMANQMLATFFGNRPNRMNRPHLLLNICFVSQHHRRRGAGRLLLEWGCKIADEMGLEAFVESSEDGRSLYEAFGFVVAEHFYLDVKTEEPSETWEALKKEIVPAPMRVWFMWRPKGGLFVPGTTVFSWK